MVVGAETKFPKHVHLSDDGAEVSNRKASGFQVRQEGGGDVTEQEMHSAYQYRVYQNVCAGRTHD